ncbi:hypothetical protein DFP72DRAFT_881753 [Ephemerocybe angulata]|uniref:MYND-type domain-containing protein n=1 Tax=Ephemerocybe angulata TaxID=980116 RepID=A0A8H6IBQ0_9AGAR|nr:hypothetical protein DFP72DRAFT_881753 [Tulosesus angulatus]
MVSGIKDPFKDLPSGATKRKLPEWLLAKCKMGIGLHLWTLSRSLSEVNCTVEIAEMIVQHLRTIYAEFDSTKKEECLFHVDTVIPSIFILQKIFSITMTYPALKPKYVDTISGSIDEICFCIDLCIRSRTLYTGSDTLGQAALLTTHWCYSDCLRYLAGQSPEVSETLVSSPRFANLVIRLWTMKDEAGLFFIDNITPEGCTIIRLLVLALGTKEGVEVFVEQLLARPIQFIVGFTKSFDARARQMLSDIEKETVRRKHALTYAGGIHFCLGIIQEHHPFLQRLFASTDYLSTISSLFYHVSSALSPDDHDIFKTLIEQTYMLSRHAFQAVYGVVRVNRALVKGEFMMLIANIMERLPPGSEPKDAAPSVISMHAVGQYSVYPTVAEQLRLAKLPPGPGLRSKVGLMVDEQVSSAWFQFEVAARIRTENVQSLEPLSVCDNPLCARPPYRNFRQCSGCSSYLYCSKRCQRQDWDTRHRHECAFARDHRARRRSSDTWYSHTTRAFHLKLLEWSYNNMVDTIEREIAQDFPFPKYLSHHALPVFDCTCLMVSISLESVQNVYRWSPEKMVCGQQYLDPRYRALMGEYSSGGARVIEAHFPMGDRELVILTVKMEKKTGHGGDYKAGYSVARYATLESARYPM